MALDNFIHTYIDNNAQKTLVLLHGTGGNERDLLPLVQDLADEYNFLGLRGNINEQGMFRFFARKEFGVFDEDSIRTQAKELQDFILYWIASHQQQLSDIHWLGYSNGANMIIAESFLYPEMVSKAGLLHPMLPLRPKPELELPHASFMISYGFNDQMIPAHQSMQVIATLQAHQAHVNVTSHEGGHEIRPEEVTAVSEFFLNN